MPRRNAGRIYVHVARFPKGQLVLYQRADRFQAVSSAVANAIKSQTPSLASRVVTICNPVSSKYFTNSPKVPTVLFVGRIAREKGVHLLIHAFLRIKGKSSDAQWKLRIIGPHGLEHGGDGALYLEELKTLAAPLGERCEFTGPIFDEGALIRQYASAGIFVYPSLAAKGESFGLAPLEAMASGCAVIVSNLACFADYVRRDTNALQFDPGANNSIDRLADCLSSLTADEHKRERLAEAGQSTAKEFLVPTIAGKMLEDFERVLRH
jgi:glycosyltransferase involved in cell wall biosynthesis